MSDVIFKGASGRLHRFFAHRPDSSFPEKPAVYCFARPGAGGRGWTPLFLSRTANLSKRLATHERWREAQLLGATHILIHERDERDAREHVEADLAEALRPVMNGPLFERAPAPQDAQTCPVIQIVRAA